LVYDPAVPRQRRIVAISIIAAIALVAPRVRAQGSVAEQLFIEGKALVDKHDYERACAKFKASHDLDPTATGTLLNLALCHEQIGKLASAWAEFREVAAESTGRREDRVTMAREHEAKVQPLLSLITLVVPREARAPGLAIQLDQGAAIADAGWETPIPVDPGEHTLGISAPGKVASTQRFVVGSSASSSKIVIAPLADAIEPSRIAPAPDPTRRTLGYVVGGTGLVAVGVGVLFGLNASAKNRDATRRCPNDVCADEATRAGASDTLASAHTSANVANVLVGAGLLLVAGGAVLVLTAPKAASAAFVRPAPLLVAGGGGLGLGGAW
jgi:hypothetical protein